MDFLESFEHVLVQKGIEKNDSNNYVNILKNHGVHKFKDLKYLNEEDLKGFGITKVVDIRKLLEVFSFEIEEFPPFSVFISYVSSETSKDADVFHDRLLRMELLNYRHLEIVPSLEKVEKIISQSQNMIVLLSQTYLMTTYCLIEFLIAKRINIPIHVAKIGKFSFETELKPFVSNFLSNEDVSKVLITKLNYSPPEIIEAIKWLVNSETETLEQIVNKIIPVGEVVTEAMMALEKKASIIQKVNPLASSSTKEPLKGVRLVGEGTLITQDKKQYFCVDQFQPVAKSVSEVVDIFTRACQEAGDACVGFHMKPEVGERYLEAALLYDGSKIEEWPPAIPETLMLYKAKRSWSSPHPKHDFLWSGCGQPGTVTSFHVKKGWDRWQAYAKVQISDKKPQTKG